MLHDEHQSTGEVDRIYIIERIVFVSLYSISLSISLIQNSLRIFVHKYKPINIDIIHSMNHWTTTIVSIAFIVV